METNINLKDLWDQEEVKTPNVTDIIKKTQKFRRKASRQVLFAIIVMMLTIVWVIGVWIISKPEWITTKIGNIIVIISIVLYIVYASNMIPLFTSPGFEINVRQHLEQLLNIRRKETFFGKRLIHFYFAFISLGIMLYLFEYLSQAPFAFRVIIGSFLILWIGMNWLYFLPKYNKKRFKKLDILIENFQKIKHQVEDH